MGLLRVGMPDQPTNLDIRNEFRSHATEDHKFQTSQESFNEKQEAFNGEMVEFKDKTEGSLASIHKKLSEIPTHEEEAKIIEEVMRKLFLKNGKLAFQTVVATGVLIGALTVILGGGKAILGWLGFVMTSK